MPGLVPGIHVFLCPTGVDGRDKPGHNQEDVARIECSAVTYQKAGIEKPAAGFPARA
jgi:hypothetical protein